MGEKEQRILGVNTQFEDINYPGLVCESFRTAISFLDYDTVLIDARSISDEYEKDYNKLNGMEVISKNDSLNMIRDFGRTKKQIMEMLNHGKNIF